MRSKRSIGLIGDYNASVPAHQAIPVALQHAAKSGDNCTSSLNVPTEEVFALSASLDS